MHARKIVLRTTSFVSFSRIKKPIWASLENAIHPLATDRSRKITIVMSLVKWKEVPPLEWQQAGINFKLKLCAKQSSWAFLSWPARAPHCRSLFFFLILHHLHHLGTTTKTFRGMWTFLIPILADRWKFIWQRQVVFIFGNSSTLDSIILHQQLVHPCVLIEWDRVELSLNILKEENSQKFSSCFSYTFHMFIDKELQPTLPGGLPLLHNHLLTSTGDHSANFPISLSVTNKSRSRCAAEEKKKQAAPAAAAQNFDRSPFLSHQTSKFFN